MYFLGPEEDPGPVLYCVSAQFMLHKQQRGQSLQFCTTNIWVSQLQIPLSLPMFSILYLLSANSYLNNCSNLKQSLHIHTHTKFQNIWDLGNGSNDLILRDK